jgi:hypothetical protein
MKLREAVAAAAKTRGSEQKRWLKFIYSQWGQPGLRMAANRLGMSTSKLKRQLGIKPDLVLEAKQVASRAAGGR